MLRLSQSETGKMLTLQLILLSGLASCLMCSPQVMHSDGPGTPDMVVRETMGILFQRVATLDNSVSFWSHTVVIKNPELRSIKIQKSFCDRKVNPRHRDIFMALCNMYEDTFKTYDEIRRSLSKEIEEKSDILQQLIPVVSVKDPLSESTTGRREKRAPLGFIGQISRNLFATATLDDVKILQEHISALENDPGRFEAFQKFADTLSSLQVETNKNMKIVTEGLRRNRLLINETIHEIDVFHDSLEEVLGNVEHRFQLMTQVVNIMHGINAREINSMSLVVAELDELVSSYLTLLKGYLPIHLMTPQRIADVLNQVQEHLKTKHPAFRVLHMRPAVYYNMPGVVSYTRTEDYLYIKFKVPITSSDLLYEVYSVQSIPITTNSNATAFTQIRKLPSYLGVTRDNKFFVELDQVSFDSCPGSNFKQCSNFLRVFQSSEPTCTSALYMNRLDHVHKQCSISLYPNPDNKETYFIDLQDGRVLISTLDLRWIKSCYHRPPEAIAGCSNCVLHKSCNCTLSSKSFFITNSIHMCSRTEMTQTEIVPNYLAGISYLKSLNPDVSLSDEKVIDGLTNLSFPPINISRSKWTLDSEKYSTADSGMDLGHILRTVRQNRSIYLKPLDAWLDGQITSSLSYSDFGSYLGYVFPIMIVVMAIVLVRLCRRQARLEFLIKHILHGKGPEMIALSTLINKAEAIEHDISNQSLLLNNHFMIISYILTAVALAYFILYAVKQCLEISRLSRSHLSNALQDQKTWLQMIITSANKSISVTLCQIDLPLKDLLYAQSADPCLPSISICGFRPSLKMDFGFLSITSITNSNLRVSLPNTISIGIIDAIRFYYIRHEPANVQILLLNTKEVKQVLLKKLHPADKYQRLIRAWEMTDLHTSGQPSSVKSDTVSSKV